MGSMEHTEAMIKAQIEAQAQTDLQSVLGNNVKFYTINTRKLGHHGEEMTLLQVNLLTPYAGNGYGMICAPRTGQNVVVLPVKGKESAPLSLGRLFQEGDAIPEYKVGDFLRVASY